MQPELPITIVPDGQFSSSLKPLLRKLEMWINFETLKANWYGNEDYILSFDFTLVRTLEEKTQHMQADNWILEPGYAYHYESSNLTTIAFIAVDDLIKSGAGIEEKIKERLKNVANAIAVQHDFFLLP